MILWPIMFGACLGGLVVLLWACWEMGGLATAADDATQAERQACIDHLDRWANAAKAADTSEGYHSGWSMCAFNAAREIERGDHIHTGEA